MQHADYAHTWWGTSEEMVQWMMVLDGSHIQPPSVFLSAWLSTSRFREAKGRREHQEEVNNKGDEVNCKWWKQIPLIDRDIHDDDLVIITTEMKCVYYPWYSM